MMKMLTSVSRLPPGQNEWLFTYHDTNNNVALALGADASGAVMTIDGVSCSIKSILSPTDFNSSMQPCCVLWASPGGQVEVFLNRRKLVSTCSSSAGRSVPAGGLFRLGGELTTFSLYVLHL